MGDYKDLLEDRDWDGGMKAKRISPKFEKTIIQLKNNIEWLRIQESDLKDKIEELTKLKESYVEDVAILASLRMSKIKEKYETKLAHDKLIDAVIIVFDVTEEQLKSNTRIEEVIDARRFIFDVLHKKSKMTFRAIGEIFGKTHGTVMNALKNGNGDVAYNRVDELKEQFPLYKEKCDTVMELMNKS